MHARNTYYPTVIFEHQLVCPCAAGRYGDDTGLNGEDVLDDADSADVLVLNRNAG
jgi:hypothetical protein